VAADARAERIGAKPSRAVVARGSDILLLLLRIVRFSELNKRPKTNSLVTMTGTASSSIHLEQFGHSLVILTPSHNRLAPGRSVPVFRGVLTSVELQIHGVRVTTLSKVSVQSGDKSPWPINASPLNIQGGSRTRESRTYSFVRGAHSDMRSCRDPHCTETYWSEKRVFVSPAK
jgi:hypothetical protein